MLLLEGRCLERMIATGYAVFVDLFRDYFGWREEEDAAARAARLVAALEALVTEGALTAERADEIGPLLGNLLSLHFGSGWDERLKRAGPEQLRHQTLLAIRDLFVAAARRQPLLLVLEDMHWADALSPDVVGLLMEAATSAPLGVLCVYRPRQQHPSRHLSTLATLKCPDQYTEIWLRELTRGQTRDLVDAILLENDLPEALREQILARARGNPFFVEELLRSLIDTGALVRDGDVWRARDPDAAIRVPDTIQSIVRSRVDPLDASLKHVLERASVIGRLFTRRLLDRIVEEPARLDALLETLVDRTLIFPERRVPEVLYAFHHVLIQETIYEGLLQRHRQRIHEQVATTIEALHADNLAEQYEALAYHYERSPANEKAIDYLLKAGEKARRAYLNEAAIGYFARALERTTGGAQRLSALTGLARVQFDSGRDEIAEPCYTEALALARELGVPAREQVRLLYRLCYICHRQQRAADGIRFGEEGLALLGDDNECVEAALLYACLAVAYYILHNPEMEREYLLRAARFADRLPYDEELEWAIVNIASAIYTDGEVERAYRCLERFERLARQHHDLRMAAQIAYGRALYFDHRRGNLTAAAAGLREAASLLDRTGDWKLAASNFNDLSWCYRDLGRLDEAAACLAEPSVVAVRSGGDRDALGSYAQRAALLLARGEPAAAQEALREAERRYLYETPDCWTPWMAGRAALALGERDDAIRAFQQLLAQGSWSDALSGLEEAWDDPAAFREFCDQYQAEHPPEPTWAPFQWYLRPATPVAGFKDRTVSLGGGDAGAAPEWRWDDPLGDCAFVTADGAIEIRAVNGRALAHGNESAPRLLLPIDGDFAVETRCIAASPDRPCQGGLLLWRDGKNFLRLDRGSFGRHEITFLGYIAGSCVTGGRGRLVADRVHLRLERVGERVTALCSADGDEWFSVGTIAFPVADPVEVGVHAIGMIDRAIYHGAYPDGTAIRFETFEISSPSISP